MIILDYDWHHLVKDTNTGLWMLSLPIEIPVNKDIHHDNLEEEHSTVYSHAMPNTPVQGTLPDGIKNYGAVMSFSKMVIFSMYVAEEEDDERMSALFTDTNASTTESSLYDSPNAQDCQMIYFLGAFHFYISIILQFVTQNVPTLFLLLLIH